MIRNRRFPIPVALLACGALGAVAARAESPPQVEITAQDLPTVHLKFDRASLDTETGVRALYSRIVAAAVAVCPTTVGRNLAVIDRVERCRRDAIAGAVRQVDSERLAALSAHRHRSG